MHFFICLFIYFWTDFFSFASLYRKLKSIEYRVTSIDRVPISENNEKTVDKEKKKHFDVKVTKHILFGNPFDWNFCIYAIGAA